MIFNEWLAELHLNLIINLLIMVGISTLIVVYFIQKK